jgi:hypothetical protein
VYLYNDVYTVLTCICIQAVLKLNKSTLEAQGADRGDFVELFESVAGFFVHYSDEKIPDTVKGWNVSALPTFSVDPRLPLLSCQVLARSYPLWRSPSTGHDAHNTIVDNTLNNVTIVWGRCWYRRLKLWRLSISAGKLVLRALFCGAQVRALPISRTSRHKDVTAVRDLYGELDKFLEARGCTLTY